MLRSEAVLDALLDAARAAADVVMHIYRDEDFGVELKGLDDPVTRADREANALLVDKLERALPGVPIVAEESDPSTWRGFENAREALFVDPIDGTREFIAKNGEFAVMIGFAEEGAPTVGVVLCPALDRTFAGIVGTGAFLVAKGGGRTPIHLSRVTDLSAARCAVSRSNRTASLDAKLAALGVKELVPLGSAGVKGVRVAEGALDIYAHPTASPVKLWDAAAPDAIVRAAGGVLTDATGRAFDYRGPFAQGSGTLAANATLHAAAVRRLQAASSEGT